MRLPLLLSAPPGDAILDVTRFDEYPNKPSGPPGENELTFVVLTQKSILLLNQDWVPIVSLKRELDPEEYSAALVAKVPQQDRYVVFYPQWHPDSRLPGYSYEYTGDGKLVRSEEIPPLPEDKVIYYASSTAGLIAANVIDGARGFPHLTLAWGNSPHDPMSHGRTLRLVIAALACAGLNLLLTRAYAFSRWRRVEWGLVGFLLGPVGVLLLWCMNDWPARVKCPSCGRKRVVNRDLCEHCGKPFDPPARDGTEILEAVAN
jgi:hypothetical protein